LRYIIAVSVAPGAWLVHKRIDASGIPGSRKRQSRIPGLKNQLRDCNP